MKIAIATNFVPFISGGAEHLAEALRCQLTARKHSVTIVRIPFRWHPAEKVVEQMLACRLMVLYGVDRIIGLKFPAYYIPHDNKVLWLLHQFRQAYDLWGTGYQDIPGTENGLRIRDVIIRSDNEYLREAKKIYTISPVTAGRLMKFNGIGSEILFPPLQRSDHFHCSGYGDYIFYPSRVTHGKRQALVAEAIHHCRTPVRVIIAGQPETPADQAAVERAIDNGGNGNRVDFYPRFLTEAEKAELFAGALGCAYVPYDEDSYGYVTLESYHSRKAVITCSDSGGTHLLVRNGETGFVANPDPQSLASAMDQLYTDRTNARLMGEAGHELIGSLGINWDHVIERLTA